MCRIKILNKKFLMNFHKHLKKKKFFCNIVLNYDPDIVRFHEIEVYHTLTLLRLRQSVYVSPGLCACHQLSMFASSSQDGTVRMWDMENHLLRLGPECYFLLVVVYILQNKN